MEFEALQNTDLLIAESVKPNKKSIDLLKVSIVLAGLALILPLISVLLLPIVLLPFAFIIGLPIVQSISALTYGLPVLVVINLINLIKKPIKRNLLSLLISILTITGWLLYMFL